MVAELGVARDEAASAKFRVSAVNMAEELLETVDRLQSRLQENQEPRKLVKSLRRLGELPMTVEILVETGVGKAVNSLRKHDIVGELAKSLVAKWKKLVPQTADRPSNSHHTKPQSHRTEERGHKRVRDPSPEPSPEPSYDKDQEEDEEESYNPNYSPQYGSPQRNSYQSDEYDSPQPELSPPPASPPPPSPPPPSPPPPSPPPPPPRKDPKQSSKPSKEVHKNHHHSRDRAEERRPSDRREGKKRDVERERQHSPEEKAPKHKRSTPQESKREEKKSQGGDGRPRAPKESPTNGEEEEFEAPSMSFESFLTYDAPISVKKKKKPGPTSSSTAISSSSSHTRASHSSSSSSSSRPSASAPPPSSSSQSSSSLPKVKKSNGSSKRPHSSSKSSSSSGPPQEKRKKVVEPVPTLPDIPLPAIQPNYRPLPSLDVTPLSPQRRKVAVANDDEDAGFTGKRLNSKMVVFSGSKTSYLPRMMTLFEQCIRVLQNNIDSIAEVGGVPFEILEPVLERCTPEQLYRIEQSNQCFTEDSDELWMRHCQRDFKREQPQEYESWRELYLRLHDEREERLRLLTQNISSAHASKPKGRQVKMAFVNSVAKPPRDIRRRQERFGTSSGSSAASTAAAAPIKVRPVFTAEPLESRSSSSASSSSLSQSSLLSAPRSSTPGVGSSPGASARDKPQVKKIAPMMAKTIKAFKNRFSRR